MGGTSGQPDMTQSYRPETTGVTMDAKWSVHLSRCRHNYRCCPRKWLATPPGDGDAWFSMEFKTWAEAMA